MNIVTIRSIDTLGIDGINIEETLEAKIIQDDESHGATVVLGSYTFNSEELISLANLVEYLIAN